MFGRITGQPSSSNQAQQTPMQASVQTSEPIEEGGLKRKAAADHLYKGDKEFSKAAEHYKKTQDWGYEERHPASIPPAVMGYKGMSAIPAAASTPSADSTIRLTQSAEFFPSKVSLTPSPKAPEACPQEKHQWVAQVFETILQQFHDLDLFQSSPSLFLVYAHNNNPLGKANAEVSQGVIQWLSNLRSNLQSDRSASGHQVLPLPATPEDTAKANDILSSQLCLLPNHDGSVEHVVLCGSELLGRYMDPPYYRRFCEEIKRAYQETIERTDDFTQVEAAIRKVVNANLNEKDFHHVLTELAFLQIRYEYHKDKHGIIPLLLNSTAQQCLPKFIVGSTAIRIEDSIWRTPSQWKGKQTYQDEGLHIGFFKLLKRLLVKQERCIALVGEKIYEACLQKLREDQSHTLTAEEFSRFMNQACVKALEALKKDHAADLRELSAQKAQENILTAIKQITGKLLVAPDQLRSALAESYSAKSLSIQRVSGEETSLNNCYINLAIVESQAQRDKDKEELKKQAKTFERLPSDERLEATNLNKLIPLERLFETQKLRNGSEAIPKRILIQGRAGIGKTTLCKKLVYEYHHNKLWQDQFECVLWVPLRQLKTSSPQRFEDLLCNQYFRSHERSRAEALAKTFYDHRDKTLFILDGLDEVASELADDRSPLKGFLEELLNQKHVVVTSRPAGVDSRILGQLDLELETIGFSPENVQTYIEKFAPPSAQTAIQQFINRTPIVQSLVNIPIQLDALCYSWDRLPRNQAVTMSMLYEAMVDKLWRKDGKRLEKEAKAGKPFGPSELFALSKARVEKVMGAEIYYLGYLAFKGLERGQIEFSIDELDKYQAELETQGPSTLILPDDFTIDLKKTSYLHTVDAEQPESERHYHFLHLTFQEFFAAKFLVRHLQANSKVVRPDSGLMFSQAELERFIAQHKYNPRYEIVWWMVAGLLKDAPLERFFTLLEQAPRDLIGGRHQQVMMECLNEAHAQLDPATVNKLEAELMQWFHFEMKLKKYWRSELGRQSAFPEHLLIKSLDALKNKRQVIETLGARSVLSVEAISALINALQDENGDVKAASFKALSHQRMLPADAVQALIVALWNEDRFIRDEAVKALGLQETLPAGVIQALIVALRDEDQTVRSTAAKALGQQEVLSDEANLALVAALRDENECGISEAAEKLGQQKTLSDDDIQVLLIFLQDKSKDKLSRLLIANELGEQKTLPEAAIQVLITALQDEEVLIRIGSANALGKQETLSDETIEALIEALEDEEKDIRSAAARALGQEKMLPEAAIQALAILLDEYGNEDVRYAATRTLNRQKILPNNVRQALDITILNDEGWYVRSEIIRALGQQKILSDRVIRELLMVLRHDSQFIRSAAIQALGQQPELPIIANLALVEALHDEDWSVHFEAGKALHTQKMLCDDVIQALAVALQDERKKNKYEIVSLLKAQKTLPDNVIQALIIALQDKNKEIRDAVAKVLACQKTLPDNVIQDLIIALRDENEEVGNPAADALVHWEKLPDSAIQALMVALQAESKSIKQRVVKVLGQQKTLSADTIMALITTLRDENEGVRCAVVKALAHQETLPGNVDQKLTAALKDESRSVRIATINALDNQKMLSDNINQALIIELIRDEDKDIRYAAVKSLGRQETLPRDTIEKLSAALKDKDWSIRVATIDALGKQKILSDRIIQALITVLQDDEDRWIRRSAAEALSHQELLPEDVDLALIETLKNEYEYKDEDEKIVDEIVNTLRNQKMLSADVILALLDAIEDENEKVSDNAISVLTAQKILSASAILVLTEALTDENKKIRDAAVAALGRQKTLPDAAIQALIKMPKDEVYIRARIAEVLRSHIDQLYMLLLSLTFEQIQFLYSYVLFPYSCTHIAPLYIQDQRLKFYTAAGLGQSDPLTLEQIAVVTQAFQVTQATLSDRGAAVSD